MDLKQLSIKIMDLKQLSIKIMEMSGMGVKQTSGTHNQFTRVVYGRI